MNTVKKILLGGLTVGILGAGTCAYIGYRIKYAACYLKNEKTYLYIDTDDNTDSLLIKMNREDIDTFGWNLINRISTFSLHTGRYAVEPGTTILGLFRQLRNHQQEPVKITIPSIRLSIAPADQPQPMALNRLAEIMARNIMADSTDVAKVLSDTASYASYGLTPETFPTLFLPNTYEVYWDISPKKLMERLNQEYQNYWNEKRRNLAKKQGVTPVEATILASLVEEETANNNEKPMVAGLYLNRLHQGMLLQADPTVKFAVGDWTIRRVLGIHLQQDNPYNTYRYKGLPPGPMRIPSIQGIESVLHAADHNYIYMCAKEDFSGTHNFAANYSEHQKNAKRYINALNQRGIK